MENFVSFLIIFLGVPVLATVIGLLVIFLGSKKYFYMLFFFPFINLLFPIFIFAIIQTYFGLLLIPAMVSMAILIASMILCYRRRRAAGIISSLALTYIIFATLVFVAQPISAYFNSQDAQKMFMTGELSKDMNALKPHEFIQNFVSYAIFGKGVHCDPVEKDCNPNYNPIGAALEKKFKAKMDSMESNDLLDGDSENSDSDDPAADNKTKDQASKNEPSNNSQINTGGFDDSDLPTVDAVEVQ